MYSQSPRALWEAFCASSALVVVVGSSHHITGHLPPSVSGSLCPSATFLAWTGQALDQALSHISTGYWKSEWTSRALNITSLRIRCWLCGSLARTVAYLGRLWIFYFFVNKGEERKGALIYYKTEDEMGRIILFVFNGQLIIFYSEIINVIHVWFQFPQAFLQQAHKTS